MSITGGCSPSRSTRRRLMVDRSGVSRARPLPCSTQPSPVRRHSRAPCRRLMSRGARNRGVRSTRAVRVSSSRRAWSCRSWNSPLKWLMPGSFFQECRESSWKLPWTRGAARGSLAGALARSFVSVPRGARACSGALAGESSGSRVSRGMRASRSSREIPRLSRPSRCCMARLVFCHCLSLARSRRPASCSVQFSSCFR